MSTWVIYTVVIIVAPFILPVLLGFLIGIWQGVLEEVWKPSKTSVQAQPKISRDVELPWLPQSPWQLRVVRAEDDEDQEAT
jgi:hypothetical protein